MSELIEHFTYQPTESVLELYDDGIFVALFGRSTVDLKENTKETKWVKEQFLAVKERYPQMILLPLLDISKVGNAEYNSDLSNALYREMLIDNRTGRVAIVGAPMGWKLFIDLFRFYARKKIKTFDQKEDGILWLREFKSDSESVE